MGNKRVIFVNNNLPDLFEFTEEIQKGSTFETLQVNFKDIKSKKLFKPTVESTISEVILVINPDFYESVKNELDDFLRPIFNIGFQNIIYLYQTRDYLKDPKVIAGKKYAAYFSPDLDIASEAIFFSLYLFTIFEKLVINHRLNDYITNSFKEVVYSELLTKKNKEINKLNAELERKNKIDNLTNLYNRNAVFDFLENERTRTLRDLWRIEDNPIQESDTNDTIEKTDQPFNHKPKGALLDHLGVFSLMMIDIDFFKKVNDTYGHLMGDEVLKVMAELLQDNTILRSSDVAGRFGGEEFIVILPETNSQNALDPAIRLSQKVKAYNFTSEEGITFNITLSIGISQFRTTDSTNDAIISRADKALYNAKDTGRDKVVIYEEVFDD